MAVNEWVGGVRRAPYHVMEENPYRPLVSVWYDPGADCVLDMQVEGFDRLRFGDWLAALLAARPAGEPAPRIRVRQEGEANLVRKAVGDRVEIVVARCPEIDDIIARHAAAHPVTPEPPSYAGAGRVPDELNALFFKTMAILFELLPDFPTEEQPFRLDAPEFDVDGGVLALFRSEGRHVEQGFVVFHEMDDYLALRDEAVAMAGTGAPADVVDVFRVSFHSAQQLPEAMRREALSKGWPVAGPDAYPRIVRRDNDGIVAPLGPADVHEATLYALALNDYLIANLADIRRGRLPDYVVRAPDVTLALPWSERPPRPPVKESRVGLRLAQVQLPPEPPAAKRKKPRKKKRSD